MRVKHTFVLVIVMAVLASITLVGCAHEHSWGEWQITSEATCSEDGVKTRICKKDANHTETMKYQKEEHTHIVKYYVDGDLIDEQAVICRTKIEPLEVEIDGNRTFDWYKTNDLSGEPFDFFSSSIASDMNFYASIYSDGLSFNLQDDNTYSVSLGTFDGEHVIVPSVFSGRTVTTIAPEGFLNASKITSVYLPPSVTEIGYAAFKDCVSLATFNYEGSVSIISAGAFEGCVKLSKFDVSDTVKGIYPNAFLGCVALADVKISNLSSLDNIGSSSFYGCESLVTLSIPDSVKNIGDYAFYNCNKLTTLNIPKSIEFIGNEVFVGTPWLNALDSEFEIIANTLIKYNGTNNGEVVTIPTEVVTIGSKVFAGKNISEVRLPDNLMALGEAVFSRSQIASIVIPSKIKILPYSLFEDCINLQTVTFAPNSAVERIMDDCFNGSTKLATLKIPKSVIEINSSAFAGCTGLKNCEFEDSSKLENILFSAFYGCINLNNLSIPDSVKFIGANTFDGCSSLANIIIGVGLEVIHNWAFNDCSSLINITIKSTSPPAITGGGVFSSSIGELSIVVPRGTLENYKTALRWSEYAANIKEEI